MPSLISETEKSNLTGIFNDIFDTFCRDIVIYKESIKTPRVINNSEAVYGFGEVQTEVGFDYSQVTGIFPATIRYKDPSLTLDDESNIQVSDGSVTIKVKRDCRDFINNGLTEKITFDERTFKLDSKEKRSSFLNSEFYIFKLLPVE